MLNYLATTSRLDILFAVHQYAKFSINPKKSYEEAVKKIGRYLKATKEEGIIYYFDHNKELKWFADSDFTGT